MNREYRLTAEQAVAYDRAMARRRQVAGECERMQEASEAELQLVVDGIHRAHGLAGIRRSMFILDPEGYVLRVSRTAEEVRTGRPE